MRQQLLVSANKHPWLLPALGLALFVHRHFLSFNGQHTPARLRPGARSRPPKLKRKPKQQQEQGDPQDATVDAEAERLDASGLAHDRLMEWFTEDEVEALHQAQANPAALMSLLCGNRFADLEGDDVSSQWSTDDEGSRQGPGSLSVEPLQLLQDNWLNSFQAAGGSPMSNGTAATGQRQQQQQLQQGDEQQSQLVQELLLQIASARQQLAEQQQQQSVLGYAQPAASTAHRLSPPVAEQGRAAAAAMQQSPASMSDYSYGDDDGDDTFDYAADYWDPNHYFALSPAAASAAGPPAPSPGHFLPRGGALWASSYPPRLGEDLQLAGDDDEDADLAGGVDLAGGADLARSADLAAAQMAAELAADLAAGLEPPFPDWEPDLGDWDFDAPDFDFDPGYDPGFADGDLGFDFDEELCKAALAAMAPAAVQPLAAVQA